MKLKKFLYTAVILTAIVVIAGSVALPSMYVAPILMYHNIDRNSDILSVSPENFERQMKFLKDAKYNVISFKELVNLMVWKKKIPAKTVVLTFDDGYENNYTNAYPILKKYHMPAIIFALPSHCGWPGYLNSQQLREISDSGIDIGSHTYSDVWLPSRDNETVREELVKSKKALEEITAKSVNFFCYPLGGVNERVRTAVMRAGYKGACAATSTDGTKPSNDIYVLKRVKVSGKSSGNLFKFWFYTSGYAVLSKELKREKK